MAAELAGGVMVEGVHIEYHPTSSIGSIVPSSGGLGSAYHGGGDGYVSDWSRDDWTVLAGTVGGRLNVARCVDIPSNMSLCRSIGYQQMRLPNLLDHDTVTETTQQASSWVPLLNIRCHANTQMFLCSLFAPVCLDRPIYPCRTLCLAVKTGCETLMLKFGFPWPAMLECDKFPLDNDLCIGVQTTDQVSSEVTSCPACGQPDTFENVIAHFCQSEFVMRVRVDKSTNSASVVSGDIRLVASKKKIYKKGGLKPRELRRQTIFHIEGGAHCQCVVGNQQQQTASAGHSTQGLVISPGNYLVMGYRQADRLLVSFLQPIDRSSSSQRRALSAIKHDRICKTATISLLEPYGAKQKNGSSRKSQSPTPTKTAAARRPPSTTAATSIDRRRKHGRGGANRLDRNGGKKNNADEKAAVSGKQAAVGAKVEGRRRKAETINPSIASNVRGLRSKTTATTRR